MNKSTSNNKGKLAARARVVETLRPELSKQTIARAKRIARSRGITVKDLLTSLVAAEESRWRVAYEIWTAVPNETKAALQRLAQERGIGLRVMVMQALEECVARQDQDEGDDSDGDDWW